MTDPRGLVWSLWCWIAFALTAAAGCGSPDSDGGEVCGPNMGCKTGYTCDAVTNRCVKVSGTVSDAAPAVDATPPAVDAPPPAVDAPPPAVDAPPAIDAMPAAIDATPAVDAMVTTVVTVHLTPGGSVTATGFSCTTGDCPLTALVGSTLTLTAVVESGYRFTGWTGNGACASSTSNPFSGPVTADMRCNANFVATLKVSALVAGAGVLPTVTSTSTGSSCAGADCTIDTGADVTLTAATIDGKRFTSWSGVAPCAGTAPVLSLTKVTAAVTCTANYVTRFSVSATLSGATGNVAAMSSDAAATCSGNTCVVDEGGSVTLTAPPLASSYFTGWSGTGCSGSSATITISPVAATISCTATYVAKKPNGNTCSMGVECQSTFCADGVCCNSACAGQCESCYDWSPGTCTATIGQPTNRPICVGGQGVCAATCDGTTRDRCVFPTTACGPMTCSDAAERVPTCSAGTCGDPQVVRDCTLTADTKRCGATTCAGVVDITAANAHTFVIMSDGSMWGWGLNFHGVLGPLPAEDDIVLPVRFPGLTGVTKLTTSPYLWHQCAIMNGGGLLCWGDNRYGQLGIGTTDNVPHPTPGAPMLVGNIPLTGVLDVGVGTYHTCAVRQDNSVTCWGWGPWGRLGDGDISRDDHYILRPGPAVMPNGTTVTSVHAVTIATGEDHTCFATENDASSPVQCFGTNFGHECGPDRTLAYSEPNDPYPGYSTMGKVVQSLMSDLDNTKKNALALGNFVSCGIASGGKVRCWGDNGEYQLGRGDDPNYVYDSELAEFVCTTPELCNGGPGTALTGVESLSLGETHACVVTAGEVVCWGGDDYGMYGIGEYADAVSYAGQGPTFSQTAVKVTSGQYHSCVLLADRTVACWGRNYLGECGVVSADWGCDSYSCLSPVVPVW